MPIKLKTSIHKANEYINRELNKRRVEILTKYAYIGEKCLNIARGKQKSGKDYLDQSGNLRSSIGYILIEDGQIIKLSNFSGVTGKKPNKKVKGWEEGKKFAQECARRYPTGIVLIIVAGMKYARYVQNKGYDVLTSAEIKGDRLVQKLLKSLES